MARSPDKPDGAPGLERGPTALRERADDGPVESPDDHEHAADHLAHVYETAAERFAAAARFVRGGLERGERCVYVTPGTDRERVLDELRARGVAVDDALADGALAVRSASDLYRADGEFDADDVLGALADLVDDATADYAGLRVAGEMSWVLGGDTSPDALAAYEAEFNRLFADETYFALCQYDRERVPAAVLRDVLRTHPYVVTDGRVCENVYYTPPAEFFSPDRAEKEVDRLLGTLRERADARATVSERTRAQRELYEVTADGDRSFHEKVDRLLELGCDRFDLGVGLFLEQAGDEFRVVRARGVDLDEGTARISANDGNYCKHTVTVEGPVGVEDVETAGWDDDPLHEEYGFGCYVGTSVTAGDDVYGSVCFTDTSPRDREFTDAEYTFLDLLGQWLSYELEREHRERDLRDARDRFRTVFERSHDAIFVNDPLADELVDVNPAGCEMLGYSREEILSRGPSDFHPSEMERFREFVDEVFENGHGWTDELTCRHRNGHRIPVELSAARIELDGRPLMLAAVRDVSERKEREAAQHRLYEIASDTERSFDEKLQALFDLGCEYFDMEFGGMARIDPEDDTFQVEAVSGDHDSLVPGAEVALSETYCRVHTDDAAATGVTNPEDAGFAETTAYQEFGVQSYLGARVTLDDAEDRTVFFVSSDPRDEPFSEGERTFHHLLAEWVKYELAHQQQTDRLATLNDLNEVVHEVANDVIRKSTREEIEHAVCERLAAADSYEFAWVAEVDPETEAVTPRAEAGVDGFLESIRLSANPDEEIGQGPAGKTFRTGDLRVSRDVFEDPAFEPWRHNAERYGFRSFAAVPVVHDGTLYGVIGLYSDRAGAFGEDEQAVLEQLGEVVGHAIVAVERKQALLSDTVVELEFRIQDAFRNQGVADAPPDRIEIDDAVPASDGNYRLYGTVADGSFAAVSRLTDEVAHWEQVRRVGTRDDRVLYELEVSDPPLLHAITREDGEFHGAVVEDGDIEVCVHLPQPAATREVLDSVSETYPDTRVVSKQELQRAEDTSYRVAKTLDTTLTDRQREVLRTAYFSGYFEWPRETSGEELADALGVSSPTFSQHLRTAQAKLFDALLDPTA